MKSIFMIFALLSVLIVGINSQIVTVADFLYQPEQTNRYVPNNYIGVVVNLDEVLPYINSTMFQGYFYNANLKGDWRNNLGSVFRMPKDWYYNCTAVGLDPNNTNVCKFQMMKNTTFYDQFGNLIWFTQSQPFWSFGVNNQLLDFTNSDVKKSLLMLLSYIYFATFKIPFIVEMGYNADQYVANGMRTGTYTSQNFLAEAATYQTILMGFAYRAPGITQTATEDWLNIIPSFFKSVQNGIYSFQPTIFMDPNQCTIANLLSDNYTKGYLKRRTTVNSSFAYSDFANQKVSLTQVKITTGNGKDGVTNTFAAALWWLDFISEATLYQFYDLSINGGSAANNFQSVFGPPPTFAPTSLYYASLMGILAVQQNATVIKPALTAGISGNVKAWGFLSNFLFKVLIINKDANASMAGKITIHAKADSRTAMSCIYLQAPSLTSKADQMKIGGHSYIGGNSTPQGNYSNVYYAYNSNLKGYQINIKYAQAALCEIPNPNIIIPTKQCSQAFFKPIILGLFLLSIVFS